ncbi:MAG: hypothetical protein M3P34_04525 [Actinomycetota bacterium]|nr:hypothetical protein [Actinomycetota bacterium]
MQVRAVAAAVDGTAARRRLARLGPPGRQPPQGTLCARRHVGPARPLVDAAAESLSGDAGRLCMRRIRRVPLPTSATVPDGVRAVQRRDPRSWLMTVAAQMLDTYPEDPGGVDKDKLRGLDPS